MNTTCLTVLVGNKLDVDEENGRKVTFEEGENMAKQHESVFFMKCSNKSGKNVEMIVAQAISSSVNTFLFNSIKYKLHLT